MIHLLILSPDIYYNQFWRQTYWNYGIKHNWIFVVVWRKLWSFLVWVKAMMDRVCITLRRPILPHHGSNQLPSRNSSSPIIFKVEIWCPESFYFLSLRDPVMISVDLILMRIGDFEDRDLVQCTGSEEAGGLGHTFVTERPARTRLDDVSNIIETHRHTHKHTDTHTDTHTHTNRGLLGPV